MNVAFCLSGLAILVSRLSMAAEPSAPAKLDRQAVEFFAQKGRPVLAANCVSCHGSKRQQAGLRLDSRTGLLKGTEDGPVVVPGEPDKSALVRAIRYTGDIKMPPKAQLPAEAVETLTAWIKMGAPWPEDAGSS